LDTNLTEFINNLGMAWGIGGWLLLPFLQKMGPAAAGKLCERVAAELKTTFASRYARTPSLVEHYKPPQVSVYSRRFHRRKVSDQSEQGSDGIASVRCAG